MLIKRILLYFIIPWTINFVSVPKMYCQNTNLTGSGTETSSGFVYSMNTNDSIDFKNYSNGFSHEDYSKISKIKTHHKQKFWCHAVFDKTFDFKNFIIQIDCSNTKSFKVYAQNQEDSLSGKLYTVPFYERNGKFCIEFSEKTTQAFIKIESYNFLDFKIISINKKKSFDLEKKYSLFYGFSLGVLILIFLYHLILFQIVQERSYLFFGIQTGVSLLYILLNSGFIVDNIHPYFRDSASILLNISLLLLLIGLLRIKTLNQSIYLRLLYLIPAYIIIGLISIAIPTLTIKIIYTLFIVITLITFIYISINYELKRGNASRLFIAAWVILSLFQVFALVKYAFPADFSMFVQNSEKIGLVLFNILMALSIGSKLSIYKDEKKIAEKLELHSLQEKERFIQEQNIILEKLIQERNKEIIEKINLSEKHKLEIEQQNETIKMSSVEIEKINQELIKKNLEISEQNKELEIHQKILEDIVNKRTKKLRKSKEKAIVAEKLKTSFLNNLTHEINTPMSAIAGYASLITDKSISQETRNEFLGKINKYVDILLETVDGVVTLSRIQSEIIKCKNTPTNLYQFYYKIVDLFKEKITLSNKKISFNSEYLIESKDVTYLTDSNKIIQIISQLIDAIVKMSYNVSLHLKFDMTQKEHDKKSKELLAITLTMSGSDESNKPIIQIISEFVKNQEIKAKYSNIVELGIAISIGLTRILKGELFIESKDQNTGDLKIEIPLINPNT